MGELRLQVAIIGAGLGGLAAAIGIARAGHKVTILEQAAVLGEVSSYSLDTLNDAHLLSYRSVPAFKSLQTRRESSSITVYLTRSSLSRSDLATSSYAPIEMARF